MPITLQINYSGTDGRSKFVKFGTDRPLEEVLEDIGKCCASGGMYNFIEDGRLIVAIPGRRIETVEQVD